VREDRLPRRGLRPAGTSAPVGLLLASAVIATCLTGCRQALPRPDRIILVTIDTLRADHVSAYGYPVEITPFLDSLAARGVAFARAFAQSATTGPSHASLFTGLYPIQHGVQANGRKLDRSFMTLAEGLAANGYRTAAFVSTNAHFRWGNLSQGFEVYDEQPLPEGRRQKGKRIRRYRPANATIDAALDWLVGVERSEKLFLWIHLYDPHKGLHPPDRDLRQVERLAKKLGRRAHQDFLRAAHGNPDRGKLYRNILLYDAEIRFVDRELRRLYAAMATEGSRDLWIVTSDHGQGLDSHHGWFGHAKQIYNVQLRVPLVFHLTEPGLPPAMIEDVIAEHVDIAPTIAELAGFELSQPRAAVQGSSLTAYLRGDRPAAVKTLSFAQSSRYRKRAPGRRPNRGKPKMSLQSLQHKYILTEGSEDELFDLSLDPHERRNLIAEPEYAGRRAELQARLLGMVETLADSEIEAESVDEDTLDRLRALGYLQ
jgi:arylsulfatase A-like enzyme